MQLSSTYNAGIRFCTCYWGFLQIYMGYFFEDKRCETITEAFQTIVKESNGKPNKIRVDKDTEFSNRSVKSWLGSNNIEICSTYNKWKSVDGEQLLETLKDKI